MPVPLIPAIASAAAHAAVGAAIYFGTRSSNNPPAEPMTAEIVTEKEFQAAFKSGSSLGGSSGSSGYNKVYDFKMPIDSYRQYQPQQDAIAKLDQRINSGERGGGGLSDRYAVMYGGANGAYAKMSSYRHSLADEYQYEYERAKMAAHKAAEEHVRAIDTYQTNSINELNGLLKPLEAIDQTKVNPVITNHLNSWINSVNEINGAIDFCQNELLKNMHPDHQNSNKEIIKVRQEQLEGAKKAIEDLSGQVIADYARVLAEEQQIKSNVEIKASLQPIEAIDQTKVNPDIINQLNSWINYVHELNAAIDFCQDELLKNMHPSHQSSNKEIIRARQEQLDGAIKGIDNLVKQAFQEAIEVTNKDLDTYQANANEEISKLLKPLEAIDQTKVNPVITNHLNSWINSVNEINGAIDFCQNELLKNMHPDHQNSNKEIIKVRQEQLEGAKKAIEDLSGQAKADYERVLSEEAVKSEEALKEQQKASYIKYMQWEFFQEKGAEIFGEFLKEELENEGLKLLAKIPSPYGAIAITANALRLGNKVIEIKDLPAQVQKIINDYHTLTNELNNLSVDDIKIQEYVNDKDKDYIYDTMKELKDQYRELHPEIEEWDFRELIEPSEHYSHDGM